MSGSDILWLIIAIVVVLALVAFLVTKGRKRREDSQREQAAELRSTAAQHDRETREKEAAALEAQAKADKARAEAQERQARAQKLEAEAERRGEGAASARETRDEHLRRADERDPDVQLDDDGRRVDTRHDDQRVDTRDDDQRRDTTRG